MFLCHRRIDFKIPVKPFVLKRMFVRFATDDNLTGVNPVLFFQFQTYIICKRGMTHGYLNIFNPFRAYNLITFNRLVVHQQMRISTMHFGSDVYLRRQSQEMHALPAAVVEIRIAVYVSTVHAS